MKYNFITTPSKNNYLRNYGQKLKIVVLLIIETYSIIESSLFLIFIPRKCNGGGDFHVCSFNETLQWGTILYNTVLIINFGTLSFFIIMYIFEFYRETVLNRYLVNNKISN